MKRLLSPLLLLLLSHVTFAQREFSLDMWDWTTPCSDLPTFTKWAADLQSIGVTRIEISAPWNRLEPTPKHYDLSYIADRLAIAESHHLGLRVRINSFYSGATPSWLQCAHELDIAGKPPLGSWIIPSINDPAFWSSYAPLCTAIARQFKGHDILFNPFIGMHAELKWSDWWEYDPASLNLWKQAIHAAPRPDWLSRVVGDAPLPEIPPIAPHTKGTPDTSPATLAHIAFREHSYRNAVAQFVAAIHAGDPLAKISVPLGESYRSQSAEMSNLDYFGLSLGASQIVHSYDFFWHYKDAPWYAAASVAAFHGITRLPIQFEFDGPFLFEQLHYTTDTVTTLAQSAMSQGAGLKAANYSGSPKLPHEWPALLNFAKLCSTAPPPTDPPANQSILLFISKWANYSYREPTPWLHDAQFGAWKMLTDQHLPVRIICEDNLPEDLTHYKAIYIAFSPPALLPPADRASLSHLASTLPSITELSTTPSSPPKNEPPPTTPLTTQHLTLNYPLAYHYLHDSNHSPSTQLLSQALTSLQISP
ncbi:MAG TPA: hypothetical protein VFE58_03415 [Tepidisphaeraceae bacterium]|jgi:hypothetical protein|nr:hypothetical protein [Tepidisphaeraceae bacterium]